MPDPTALSADLTLTLGGIAVCALLGLFSFRRHFGPNESVHYRRINWMIVCLACIAIAFVLVVHLVNIAGFETGRR